MKKLFLLLLVLPFLACSSDDNNEPEDDILRLTRWTQTIDKTSYTFQFTTQNYCNYLRQREDFTPFTSKYKYRVEGDKVFIHRMMETTDLAVGIIENEILKITFDEIDLELKQVPYVNPK